MPPSSELYAAETWTLSQADRGTLEAFEILFHKLPVCLYLPDSMSMFLQHIVWHSIPYTSQFTVHPTRDKTPRLIVGANVLWHVHSFRLVACTIQLVHWERCGELSSLLQLSHHRQQHKSSKQQLRSTALVTAVCQQQLDTDCCTQTASQLCMFQARLSSSLCLRTSSLCASHTKSWFCTSVLRMIMQQVNSMQKIPLPVYIHPSPLKFLHTKQLVFCYSITVCSSVFHVLCPKTGM